MPELPEVETIKNNLLKKIQNKTIKDVIVLRNKIIDGDEFKFVETLKNKKIINLSRIGKFLIFELDYDLILLVHLRLEGKFFYSNNSNFKSQFARIIFKFNDESVLNYDDSRVFGYMSIRNKDNYKILPPISKLGKEANTDIDVDEVFEKFNKDKRCIKEVLLDQSILSGLGNIYVDETLFESKICPLSTSNLLTKEEVKTILKNAKEILNKSIQFNGSTVKTFSFDINHAGDFQQFLNAYGKKGEPCKRCGHKLVKIFISGRGTTYCPNCQKLKCNKYVIGITGPINVGKSLALETFKKSGYLTYSCDERVNSLYNDSEFKKQLLKYFNTDSKNDIKNIIKSDNSKIQILNNLIHPIIEKDIKKFIRNNKGFMALEIPLLFQNNLDKYLDETLLILTNNSNRENTKSDAANSVNRKLNYQLYKSQATYVVNNNTTKEDFIENIKSICKC